MNAVVNIQLCNCNYCDLPNNEFIISLINKIFLFFKINGEVTIRIVDKEEMRKLNNFYCKKNYATNVLSFSFLEEGKIFVPPFLGDIVICYSVVKLEAMQKCKLFVDYFVYLIVHSILHLLGYNHDYEFCYKEMVYLENKIMNILRFV